MGLDLRNERPVTGLPVPEPSACIWRATCRRKEEEEEAEEEEVEGREEEGRRKAAVEGRSVQHWRRTTESRREGRRTREIAAGVLLLGQGGKEGGGKGRMRKGWRWWFEKNAPCQTYRVGMMRWLHCFRREREGGREARGGKACYCSS